MASAPHSKESRHVLRSRHFFVTLFFFHSSTQRSLQIQTRHCEWLLWCPQHSLLSPFSGSFIVPSASDHVDIYRSATTSLITTCSTLIPHLLTTFFYVSPSALHLYLFPFSLAASVLSNFHSRLSFFDLLCFLLSVLPHSCVLATVSNYAQKHKKICVFHPLFALPWIRISTFPTSRSCRPLWTGFFPHPLNSFSTELPV
jgi:hypothetical protein